LKKSDVLHDQHLGEDSQPGGLAEAHRLGSINIRKWTHQGIDFSTWDLTNEDVYQETHQVSLFILFCYYLFLI